MSITVIIPAWNEAESIGTVLAAIPWHAVDEVLVIDGGSTDQTVAIARAANARVVVEARRGYGRACATGVELARGDIVVFLDADGADDPRWMLDLTAPVIAGEADLALGSRLSGKLEPGAMPWHQRAGNWLAAGLINLLYGVRLTDLSPFRAVHRARLMELSLREMTFGWPVEMIVKAARRGWRMVELPLGYRTRLGGRSKISGTLKGSLLAGYYILTIIARYARESNER